MLRLAAFLVITFALPATAQTFESAYAFGGTSSDVAESVAVDGDGNTFVVGTFEGSIDFGNGITITSAGDSDAFVVMFDANGTPQWARRAGTDVFNDFGEAVAVDAVDGDLGEPADGVYMAGTFTGIATFDGGANPDTTITTFSDFDAFLAKYDAAGDLQWVERVGGLEQDVANSVAVTPEGSDVFLVGSFTGEAEAGDTTLVSAGSSDAYLARFTTDGDLVWARSAGGTSSDSAYDVAVTFQGDVFAVGQFGGVIQFDDDVALQSVGLSDIFVVRYADDGDVVWAERLGGSESDFVRGVALSGQGYYDASTAVFVGGSFSDTIIAGPDVLTSAGFTDVFAAALDAEGSVLWGRRGGGPDFDFAEDIQTFPPYAVPVRGDEPTTTPVYVTGYIDGAATFEDPDGSVSVNSAGGLDGFLAAYQTGDSFNGGVGGTLIDAFAFGGTNRDQGTGVAVLPQSDIGNTFNLNLDPVLTGFFRGTASFGDFELESAGSNDGFVARVQNCPSVFCLPTSVEPGVGVPTATALGAAYPNPFRDRTTLALDVAVAQDVTVEVFDVLGRRVATVHDGPLDVGEHRVVIDAGGLPAGVYVVRAEGEAFRFTQRVTLVR